jgi:hypothetical protein
MRYIGLDIGLFLAALAVGCVRYDTLPLPPFDPAATFVAHSVHGGLAIDRIPGGTTGRIQGRDAGLFVVTSGDTPIAVVRITTLATVVGRTQGGEDAPPTLWVTPSWTPEGIRLAVTSPSGTLHTTSFVRIDGRSGLQTLSRNGQTTLDVRGEFRADVLDAGGTRRGWYTVRVPGPDESRLFTSDLPGASGAVPSAMALALVSELDWIDDHVIDVYRGTGRDRGGGGQGQGR